MYNPNTMGEAGHFLLHPHGCQSFQTINYQLQLVLTALYVASAKLLLHHQGYAAPMQMPTTGFHMRYNHMLSSTQQNTCNNSLCGADTHA